MSIDWTDLHLLDIWNDPGVVLAALSQAGTIDPDVFEPRTAA